VPLAPNDFQVFAKPAGPACNLGCGYCYYLGKKDLLGSGSPRMSDELLETYIIQHLEAHPGPTVAFSWHGGEPTLLGLDFFRRAVALQKKHLPPGRRVRNGIQTNGTLLDDGWGRFLAGEGFSVGLSLDGPRRLHDRLRLTRDGQPTHDRARRGFDLLMKHGLTPEILCVVGAHNVHHPLEVYRFFREIGAVHVSFLPLVIPGPAGGAGPLSVPAAAWGEFLCAVFDQWLERDIGRLKVQIFEEAARTAFGQEHSLCIFRPTCGQIPVVEHNGDFYSCDHFVEPGHRLGNIRETHLARLLDSPAQKAFGRAKLENLPDLCRTCPVRSMCHGGCPKNRFLKTPDGQEGLNYLCQGYKRFFTHCRPFLEEVAAQWRRQSTSGAEGGAAEAGDKPKVGRNDPCPCGSGRKYKRCCLGR